MKKNLLLLALLPFLSIAQVQIGQDIDGEVAGDISGRSVSLSADGNVLAIGATQNDDNGTSSGHVRIYQNQSNVWIQIGSDIDGESAGDFSGCSISLSADGNVVAIGAQGNDGNGTNSGQVRIYQNQSGVWTQIGSDIDGESADDNSGCSISLSADGNVVAIGAQGNDDNGIDSGHVRIYQNQFGVWTQIGTDIDGESAGDFSGCSISLSADGNVVAIGARYNDGNGSNSGHVRIYQNQLGVWTQIGTDIDGESVGDNSGYSISLSADGNIIAIGALYNDGNGTNSGHVRIYQNQFGIWTQIGIDIDGETAVDNSGSGISLSTDGSIIAIGAPRNAGNGTSSGHVRIYQNQFGVWTQIGTDIDGEAVGDESGWGVSISADGSTLIIGAYLNDGNGASAGQARVYDISCLHSTIWDGTAWSNGKPTGTSSVTFTGNYSSIESIIAGCNVMVTNNAQVIINNGHTLNVGGQVTVDSGSILTIENNAALRQKKEVTNIGNIIVKRTSSPMLRLDYTAWSSPVVGQQLQSFSPNTLANRFYTYDPNGSTTPTAYISVDAQTNFQPTVGYMIRSANNASSTVTHVHNGAFTGVPNNGEFSLTPGIVYNLIGNPYASPISTTAFFNDNAGVSTLYYWTNTTQAIPDPNPPYNNYYPQNNFASQTRFTSVAAYNGVETPNGYIQTGQGFFTAVGFPSQIKFKNSQRVDAVNSSQFFRTAQSTATTVNNEVDAIWLNLNDSSNAYNQMVVGYSANATNNEDYGYDGKFFGDLPTALYTTINNDAFVIQAKAMPFVDTDVIPLGFKAENQGMFTISLEKVEGLFENQNVYLKDNLLNIVHDIKLNSYQFTSISGTFNSRFELVFTNTALSQEEFISNSTLVYYNGNNEIVVKSTESAIAEIQLYDITGRLLYSKNAIGANEFSIAKDLDKQLIIVKTKLENNKMNTTKLMR